MFERFANGWELAKESWEVLKLDKELLLFPVMSGICCLLVLASFVLPLWGFGVIDELIANSNGDENPLQQPLIYAAMLLYYWVTYFVIVYFNSALVACAVIRFRGENPTLGDGLRAATERLPQILGWSFVAATVGVILRAIESRSEKAGQFAAALLGTAWSIATYFVVPVIVIEKTNPIESVKRSTSIMRSAWGEALGANFGVGFIMFLATLPGIALVVGGGIVIAKGLAAIGIALIILGVVWMLVASLIASALDTIILAALYLFAAYGTVPEYFHSGMLEHAFVNKR